MSNYFTLENGQYGLKAVINGIMPLTAPADFGQHGVVEIELNRSKGWCGEDISFLREMPFLQSIDIIDMQIRDVTPVHHLNNLKRLRLLTYCKTPIDFKAFPDLKDCGLEWRKGCHSIFECESLQKLFINGFDKKTWRILNN